MAGWLKVKDAAKYAGVSERTLETWLHNGLKYVRLPSGLRLIKLNWVDEFLEGYLASEKRIDKMVENILNKLN